MPILEKFVQFAPVDETYHDETGEARAATETASAYHHDSITGMMMMGGQATGGGLMDENEINRRLSQFNNEDAGLCVAGTSSAGNEYGATSSAHSGSIYQEQMVEQ